MKNKTIKQSFSVSYSYSLYVTKGVFHTENPMLYKVLHSYKPNKPIKVLFVIDDGVQEHHPGILTQIDAYCKTYSRQITHTHSMVVPGGELCKADDNAVTQVLTAIDKYRICRHSFVVAIGGGALIDMVGYAATIAHRGVKLIRIPTTVLAQNDAAVGVKNGVNAFGKKNFTGTFAVPYAIINDGEFLKTLEQRDWIAGIAEAIKVALIKDASFFDYVKTHARALKNREEAPMQYLIHRCAELHMQHIAQGGDPFESGSSRPLDFGHWSAHKLEQMTHYTLRHGEAVAKGIALDVAYAHQMGLVDQETLNTVIDVLLQVGFDLSIPVKTKSRQEELLEGIEEFREHLGGQLTITLITAIGKKYDVHEIDREKMVQAIVLVQSLTKEKVE